MSWPDPKSLVFQNDPPIGSDPDHPDAALLLWAYGHGVFPMAETRDGRDEIHWYRPDPRGVLPLQPVEAFHIPRNLAREVRRQRFEVRSDTAFEPVIRACAGPRSHDNGSWHSEPLIRGYLDLQRRGFAHSVEAWLGDVLVGGLYGVSIGGAFFGESMFSRPDLGGSNSSKVCLVHLVRWLRHCGFTLLDTQFANEHLQQFGVHEIAAREYHRRLDAALRLPVSWGDFNSGTDME